MSGLIQQKSTSTTRLKHTKKRAFSGSFKMEEEVGFEQIFLLFVVSNFIPQPPVLFNLESLFFW